MPRHFPAPWTAERIPGGYVVKDATGQSLVYVWARETKAEAVAVGFSRRCQINRVPEKSNRIAPGTVVLPGGQSPSLTRFRS